MSEPTNLLHKITNHEDGVTAFVFRSDLQHGTFAVSLRDDDSGNVIPNAIHGIITENAALEIATKWANIQ